MSGDGHNNLVTTASSFIQTGKKNGFVNVNPHLSFLHHSIKTLVDQAYFANTWNKIQFTTATVGFNPNSTKTKDAVWAVQSR